MTIKWIVFDLGGVVVNLARESAVDKLQELTGCTVDTAKAALTESLPAILGEKRLIEKFCLGQLDKNIYLESMLKMIDHKIDKSTAEAVVNSILAGENPETIKILENLAKHYKLACFSNTHQLHWDHMQTNYGFFKFFHYSMASHLAGLLKPDPRVYKYMENQLKESPENCVFIDDILENVIAARNAGWHGIVYSNPQQLIQELARLNINEN